MHRYPRLPPAPTAARSAWEVWELIVKVKVEGKGQDGEVPPFTVSVTADCDIPDRLQVAMAEKVGEQWRGLLVAVRDAGEVGWCLDDLFSLMQLPGPQRLSKTHPPMPTNVLCLVLPRSSSPCLAARSSWRCVFLKKFFGVRWGPVFS